MGLEIVIAIFQLLVFVVGVPGNLLILQVFFKKTRKTSTNVFIMALASADLMACLLRPVYVGMSLVLFTTGEYASIWIEITYTAFNSITVYSSAIITAAIAFDRYDAVCRPHTRLMSYRCAQVLALMCFIISIPMAIPSVLIYFNHTVPARLSKHIVTFSAYILALILVVVFYVMVYKAVLFRTKVRTKWGGRFTGITAAGETSVSMTGHTEVSALPLSREFTKLSPVTEQEASQAGNHVEDRVQPSVHPPCAQSPTSTAPTDLEIACVSEDKNAVVYHNLANTVVPSPDTTPAIPPPAYSVAISPACPPATPGPSSRISGGNLAVPNNSRIPTSSNFPERTGSTGRNRTPSERGKSSKTVAARMQNKTTRMLLLTTIVFFVTWIPYMCLSVLNTYFTITNENIRQEVGDVLNTASHLLFVNNAANPFIYVLANRQFRNDCKREVRKLMRSCSRR
ncbi:cholecystokinin receptor type A-like [Patiria miniata]|uniref:G-protein coupled receptors family 1 profile domain-containing protein n=1 Tax=Patiria miniata TaxID=46514 RepID=A0A914A7K0_PATMI|nr:cholecystokinin receptor type A-like [Patiria miniata]